MSIAENLQEIEGIIAETAIKNGRKPEEVKLITVSKTVDVKRVNEAIQAGAKRIGENRVQELMEKIPLLLPVEKHFIGVLQKNKVKYLAGEVDLIHSVDREELIKEIDRQSEKRSVKTNILLQVHIGGEKSKSGVAPENLSSLVEKTLQYPNVTLCGLMTVPPPAKGDEARAYFENLRQCFMEVRDRYKKELPAFKELSMGMSGDYQEAIMEGATFVRVGSAIFGKRFYG